MKASNHFDIKELVHPEYITEHGEEKMVRVLKRYAPFMLDGLEQLRSFIGGEGIIINDYKWGGNFINSGVRHAQFPLKNASLLSAHYFMQATDCKVKTRSVRDLQESILDSPHLNPYILRMENWQATPTWLHIQWGYRLPSQTINVFNP